MNEVDREKISITEYQSIFLEHPEWGLREYLQYCYAKHEENKQKMRNNQDMTQALGTFLQAMFQQR